VTIDERIREVRGRIAAAAEQAGRSPRAITLVAVSKTVPVDACRAALQAGVTDLGENRAQELREKMDLIGARTRWHFIGHLQTNKVRLVVGAAALIHAVDRIDLATAIARRAARMKLTQDVLLQVNVSGEPNKHGVNPDAVAQLAHDVDALEGVKVRGLMTMPPYPNDPEDSRPLYKELATLRNSIAEEIPSARDLSMGMTRDFEVAIEEGATYVRIGEAVFGPRKTP